MKECTTHHHACDCREAICKELAQALEDMLWHFTSTRGRRASEVRAYAVEALEKYREANK